MIPDMAGMSISSFLYRKASTDKSRLFPREDAARENRKNAKESRSSTMMTPIT